MLRARPSPGCVCAQDELRDRIRADGSASQLVGPANEVLNNLDVVFVLIFNMGNPDEGVYTLQGRTAPASPYVLAFEKTDEVPLRVPAPPATQP